MYILIVFLLSPVPVLTLHLHRTIKQKHVNKDCIWFRGQPVIVATIVRAPYGTLGVGVGAPLVRRVSWHSAGPWSVLWRPGNRLPLPV